MVALNLAEAAAVLETMALVQEVHSKPFSQIQMRIMLLKRIYPNTNIYQVLEIRQLGPC